MNRNGETELYLATVVGVGVVFPVVVVVPQLADGFEGFGSDLS